MNVDELFLRSIYAGQKDRNDGVHITTLTSSPCLRKGWYTQRFGEFGNAQDAMTLWIGRQLHLSPVLPEHELDLIWEVDERLPFVTAIDEYDRTTGKSIEKKSTKELIKKYLPNKNHITQVEYQNVMLWKNDLPLITDANIFYIEKAYPHRKHNCRVSLRDPEKVAPEMLKGREAILSPKIPPREASDWACNYCSFVPKCFSDTPDNFERLFPFLRKDSRIK